MKINKRLEKNLKLYNEFIDYFNLDILFSVLDKDFLLDRIDYLITSEKYKIILLTKLKNEVDKRNNNKKWFKFKLKHSYNEDIEQSEYRLKKLIEYKNENK